MWKAPKCALPKDILQLPIVGFSEHVCILDVAPLLPTASAPYRKRSTQQIKEVIYHHTAGNTKPYPEGLWDTACFFVRPIVEGGHGWPGFGYHYYVPHNPPQIEPGVLDSRTRHVVFMCQHPETRSYHTKDHRRGSKITPNNYGVGVVFQGCFDTHTEPTETQLLIARELWTDILAPKFGLPLTAISGHYRYGKPTCPGPQLQGIVEDFRNSR